MVEGLAAILTFDLDGVLCRPPLGINIGISRALSVAPLPANVLPRGARHGLSGRLATFLDILRYAGRSPLPDAREALSTICKLRTPVLVTARAATGLPFLEHWLRRHDLHDCFAAIYANDTTLRSAQFKLHRVRALGAPAHVDDDGATAYYLARHGTRKVYLRDWPRNRGLPFPPSVNRIRSLLELPELLARDGDAPL